MHFSNDNWSFAYEITNVSLSRGYLRQLKPNQFTDPVSISILSTLMKKGLIFVPTKKRLKVIYVCYRATSARQWKFDKAIDKNQNCSFSHDEMIRQHQGRLRINQT